MQSTMMNHDLLLDDILERAGQQFADTEIVSHIPDKSLFRYTYGELRHRSRSLAKALLDMGLEHGERVATLMWNHHIHLEAYFGIPVAGLVMHTLNLKLSPEAIAWTVNHAEDQVLIVDDVLLPLYERFADQVDFRTVIVVSLKEDGTPDGMVSYEDFIANGDAGFSYPPKTETDACGMCYTSGTTGNPKGVVYSHRSTVLHAMTGCLPDTIGVSFKDTVLPVVPMFHANAWGLPYSATMAGAKQVFPGPHMDAESLLKLFEKEQVTLTGGVPTIWMALQQALEAEPDRWTLPAMRMIVGGSAVPESMFQFFDRHGLHIVQGWGMTETSPIAAITQLKPKFENDSKDAQYARRSMSGVPVPFMNVRTVDDDGHVCPWDGEAMGEIQVQGPWVTGQYYKLDQTEDKFTDDGWLRTGDVATVDADGYIDITDRTKDLIKSGGEWISSVHLENELMAHEGVAEAAVIARPHPKWGERPLACIVRNPGSEVAADELRDFMSQRMEKWMCPDGYVFIDEVPRTSTGKFSKLDLRKQFGDWEWEAA